MASIFLCHASEDKPLAEPIQLALTSAGHNVFYDEKSLPPGGDYNHRISNALNSCDIYIFLVSVSSVAHGKYTLSELKFAQIKWPNPVNRVLAVRLDNIETKKIPPYLTATTLLDTKGNLAAEIRASVEAMLRYHRKNMIKRIMTYTSVLISAYLVIKFSISIKTHEASELKLKFTDTHDVNFYDAVDIPIVSKAKAISPCLRMEVKYLEIGDKYNVNWELFDQSGKSILKHQKAHTATSNVKTHYSCRRSFLDNPTGNYIFKVSIAGANSEKSIQLTE